MVRPVGLESQSDSPTHGFGERFLRNLTASVRLPRSLELSERLLASLAHDLIHEDRGSAHLVLDIATECGLRLRHFLGMDADPFLAYRLAHRFPLLPGPPLWSTG